MLPSQVIIRERVEIHPRPAPKLSSVEDSVLNYFNPPPLVMQDGFPTVTLTSFIEVGGGFNENPEVLLPGEIAHIVFMRGSQEQSLCSISRDP
jgi:hypothetical protein